MGKAIDFRSIVLITMMMLPFMAQAAMKQVWVGQTFYCDVASHFNNVYSQSDIKWNSSVPYLQSLGGTYNRGFVVTQYFKGTATITCEWKETAFPSIPSLTQTYNRKVTWTISCISNPVSISKSELVINQGETTWLYYKHKYDNNYTSYATPFFSTSNSDIVSVSQTGEIKALKGGVAYVYCYSNISGEQPYCKVTVIGKKPTGVSIPSTMELVIGDKQKITPTFTPSDASANLTWSSSHETVATVSDDGTVTALAEGTTTIKVVTDNNLSATCQLTVTNNPKQVELIKETDEVFTNDDVKLTVKLTPSHATTTYTWSSDNEEVATVNSPSKDSKEVYVKAHKGGKANITVKTENGLSASCEIMVKEYSTTEEAGRKIRKAKERVAEDVIFIRDKHLK